MWNETIVLMRRVPHLLNTSKKEMGINIHTKSVLELNHHLTVRTMPLVSKKPSYRPLLNALLSTLFACASKNLQHVNVYLHAFVHASSLFSASLIL